MGLRICAMISILLEYNSHSAKEINCIRPLIVVKGVGGELCQFYFHIGDQYISRDDLSAINWKMQRKWTKLNHSKRCQPPLITLFISQENCLKTPLMFIKSNSSHVLDHFLPDS